VAIDGAEKNTVRPALALPPVGESLGAANLYCTIADAAVDGVIDFASEADLSFNYEYRGTGGAYNSQAAIYHWVRRDEIVITVAFRGSETVHFEASFEALATSAAQMLADWIGTDSFAAPVADLICNNPDVRIHNGMQNAYLLMGHDVASKLVWLVGEMRSQHAGKPLKIFVTGHSLGAALADMFTYDIACGGTLGGQAAVEAGLGQSLAGTVTFGHAFHWYGEPSVKAYMDLVPPGKRIRINACAREQEGWSYLTGIGACAFMHSSSSCGDGSTCDAMCHGGDWEWCDADCGTFDVACQTKRAACYLALPACLATKAACQLAYSTCRTPALACEEKALPENMFASCDLVGSTLPTRGVGDGEGFVHPDDGDFQAAWLMKRESDQLRSLEELVMKVCSGVALHRSFRNAYGVPNAFIAHLLDAYSEGMRRNDRFNGGICARIHDPDYMLTPDFDQFGDDPISLEHGEAANQVGYPEGVDRCWCTGNGDELRCSQSGIRHCGVGTEEFCNPLPPLPFGDWSMCYPVAAA